MPSLKIYSRALLLATAFLPVLLCAQDAEKVEDSWIQTRDQQTGLLLSTRQLTVYPKGEPQPALKYRLLPDEFERVEGNSAVFYLKALGYLEQEHARDKVREFIQNAQKQIAKLPDKSLSDVPPYVWNDTPPKDFPVKEVKEYLALTEFQTGFLHEASLRTKFTMDRQFRTLDDPIAYLLPEIQNLREVARLQSMRCRLAIAEKRYDDAIEILRQQFSLAEHLGQDDFLVSTLVGIAISNIAWHDALYLSEEENAPNLYWALASMPRPLVNLRHAMSIERQFFYQQVKVLREVDQRPRPAGYWQDFIDRLIPQLGLLVNELRLPRPGDDPKTKRAMVVAFVAASYPGAKRYLLEVAKLPAQQVDDYPTAQVVFLAMKHHYERHRDEIFKWTFVPLSQARSKSAFTNVEQRLQKESESYGWFTTPTSVLLPAILAVRNAEARCEQTIALLQTVEAIRIYAADNESALPPSLDKLTVPAPSDPYTGRPIDYEKIGDKGILTGHALRGMQYRIVVRIAK